MRFSPEKPIFGRGLFLSALIALFFVQGLMSAEAKRPLMRFPDIHGDTIVFVHGEDIWSVPSQGGTANRLTIHDGQERFPKFSPDGSQIAFTGEYDGNNDVFVMDIHAQDKTEGYDKIVIKRYLVERTFPDGLNIPVNTEGSEICLTVVSTNAQDNVSWVHSYVTKDKKKTFCIYDAPSPEAIRKAADKNGLPVDNIVEVSVLDPYFYK